MARLAWPIEWARTALMGTRRIVMVANGAGPARAAEAARTAREQLTARAVVNTGFCGALDPALRVGEIFVGSDLRIDEISIPLAMPGTAKPYAHGAIVSIDRVADTVEEKSRLRAKGAAAVEMEAAGIAPVVREWKLPFFCIRAVTDRADEGFTIDLNASRLPNGRFSMRRILVAAMRRPATGLPELSRLRTNSVIAARSLGDFLVDCRF